MMIFLKNFQGRSEALTPLKCKVRGSAVSLLRSFFKFPLFSLELTKSVGHDLGSWYSRLFAEVFSVPYIPSAENQPVWEQSYLIKHCTLTSTHSRVLKVHWVTDSGCRLQWHLLMRVISLNSGTGITEVVLLMMITKETVMIRSLKIWWVYMASEWFSSLSELLDSNCYKCLLSVVFYRI